MSSGGLSPYLKHIQQYPVLSRDEEYSLIKRFKKGDGQAREKLVTANLRLVIAVAKRYQYQGLSFADLISEGSIGLINAAKQFDESRGVRFSSFAIWLIRRQIFHAIANTAQIVRLPMKQVLSLRHQYRDLKRLADQLRQNEASYETIRYIERRIGGIKRKLNAASPYVSLDAPYISGNDVRPFVEFLPEDIDKRPDRIACQNIDQGFVRRALLDLGERERKIIELYYGFHGEEPRTLQEIGKIFELTRERVRQIKAEAIEKLQQTLHVRN